jgi:serine/threonine protein kinase
MAEPPSIDKLIGTMLGSYRLEQLLESRSLAPVFLARNSTTGAMYRLSILTLPADLPSEQRIVYLGRFQQEAISISALHHPSILPLFDYGNSGGMPYLVWAHPPMKPLNVELAKGPMDLIQITRYLDQIAAALEHAHEQGVLHRNLTTDCIFVSDRNLVVAEFGVLRMLQLSKQDPKTDPLYGMSASSAPAPEQVQVRPIDSYTDVYALGAVLYRMLTGHRVFRGETLQKVAEQHAFMLVPSPSTWRSGLPAGLDGIIAKAMAKEPTGRFSQPGALANAYAQVIAPNDTSRRAFVMAPPHPVTPPTGEHKGNKAALPLRRVEQPATRISRRRALTVLAAGGGGAVAVAAVAVVASHFLAGNTTPTAPSPSQTTSTPGHTGTVLARTSDVSLNSAKQFPIANSSNPGLLIHLPSNQFVAYNSTCTHASCGVSYNPQNKLLECPCHGAVFDPAKNAAVVSGPAPTPLAPVKITVNADGTITTG